MAGHRVAILGLLGSSPALQFPASEVLPKLLVLRGGVQPSLAVNERLPSSKVSTDAAPLKLPTRRKSRRTKGSTEFGVRDAVTSLLCLSAVGAVAVSAGGTNLDPLMAALVPRDMMSAAWILFGGTLSLGLFTIVRLSNSDRAPKYDHVLSV